MVCQQIPQEAAASFETLPELYLGLGVQRNATSGTAQGTTHDVPTQGIDLSILRNREALDCFNTLIRNNTSLLNYTATTLQIIRHFQQVDAVDPNHITWAELTRDYGADASSVAYSLNAYLGIVTYLSQSSAAPRFSAQGLTGGACPNVSAQTLASYETVAQAYVGLGLDRDAATGVARRASSGLPVSGLDLSPLNDATAVACIENMARNNPGFTADLHQVQGIIRSLRETNPRNPNLLTADTVVQMYGQGAGHVIVSINAYLGLVRQVQGVPAAPARTPEESGVNPWLIGGLALGGVAVIGGTAFVLLRNRVGGSSAEGQQNIQQQIREMSEDAGRVAPQPNPQPPTPPPPPPPESFVRRGTEAVRLPIPRNGYGVVRFTLGRQGSGSNFVSIPNESVDAERAFISSQHAEIAWDTATRQLTLRDLGSLNGTEVFRDANGLCSRIAVPANAEIPLQAGDVVRFGRSYYRVTIPAIGPVLERMALASDALAPEMRVVPPDFTPERPLIDRLRDAQRDGRPIEIFVSDSKGKYAGRVMDITEGPGGMVTLRAGNNRTITVPLNQVVTVRGRGDADDLTARYSRLANPQFRDKSYNDMAMNAFQVMVDYADPRLTNWLERDVGRIRDRLDRGELNQQQAAAQVWELVRIHIPYDESRYRDGASRAQLPDQLYRLGDFLQTGVCNERGMLVQVALQYLGIESRFVIGNVPGGRHAWVRANIRDVRGRVTDLLIDPQRSRVFQVGRDGEVNTYIEENTNYAHAHKGTMLGGGDMRNFARIMSFSEWNPVMDRPIDSAQLEASLQQARPELADYFRRYVCGNSGMRLQTVRDLVMTMGFADDGTILREAYQTATAGGRPIQDNMNTAIFEMVARGAQLRDMWHPANDAERQVAGQAFQTEAARRNVVAPVIVASPRGAAWDGLRSYGLRHDAIYNSLRQIDPTLAEFFRSRISTDASRVRNIGDLVDRIALIYPQAIETAPRMPNLGGLSVQQAPERAIFELIAQAAEGLKQWADPEPAQRMNRAANFELRGRNAGVLAGTTPAVTPAAASPLNRFRADPIRDGDFYQGLQQADPTGRLARAYRAISSEARPVRNIGQFLDFVEAHQPGLVTTVIADLQRQGLSLDSSPWRVLFEVSARFAVPNGGNAARPEDVRQRLSLSADFETRMGGPQRDADTSGRSADDARERERRERLERDRAR